MWTRWIGICVYLGVAPAWAGDEIQRCVDPQGVSIYTDQPCSVFGAQGRVPVAEPTPPEIEPGVIRSDCARKYDTLLFDVRRAIESDNVNALAGLYHWVGVRGGGAVHVMNRLEDLTERPMASVELIYPEVAPVHDNPEAFPEGTPPEDPIGVRVQQMQPGEIAPSAATELQLVRHAECWWLRF